MLITLLVVDDYGVVMHCQLWWKISQAELASSNTLLRLQIVGCLTVAEISGNDRGMAAMHPDSVENSVRYSLEFHLHTSAYRIMNKRDKKTKMHRNTHYQLKKVFSVFFMLIQCTVSRSM